MITKDQLQWIVNDPQAWLSRGEKLSARIQAKRKQISRLHEICTATTQALKQVVVYTGPTNKIEKCMTEAFDLEREIMVEIEELLQIQREIAESISLLLDDTKLITILEMRYLSGYRMEEIADSLIYSLRWIQRLHAEALAQMKKNALFKLQC